MSELNQPVVQGILLAYNTNVKCPFTPIVSNINMQLHCINHPSPSVGGVYKHWEYSNLRVLKMWNGQASSNSISPSPSPPTCPESALYYLMHCGALQFFLIEQTTLKWLLVCSIYLDLWYQGRSTRGGHSGFGRCTFPIIPSSDSRETADGRGWGSLAEPARVAVADWEGFELSMRRA